MIIQEELITTRRTATILIILLTLLALGVTVCVGADNNVYKEKGMEYDRILLKNWFEIFIVSIGLVILIFISLILLGYKSNRSLDKTEMRRAIAGTFVVGIHCLLFLSIVFNIERSIIIGAYLGGVSSIIGFYFGFRTIQQQSSFKIERFNIPKKFEISEKIKEEVGEK